MGNQLHRSTLRSFLAAPQGSARSFFSMPLFFTDLCELAGRTHSQTLSGHFAGFPAEESLCRTCSGVPLVAGVKLRHLSTTKHLSGAPALGPPWLKLRTSHLACRMPNASSDGNNHHVPLLLKPTWNMLLLTGSITEQLHRKLSTHVEFQSTVDCFRVYRRSITKDCGLQHPVLTFLLDPYCIPSRDTCIAQCSQRVGLRRTDGRQIAQLRSNQSREDMFGVPLCKNPAKLLGRSISSDIRIQGS